MLSFTSKNHGLGDVFNVLSMANIVMYISAMMAHANQWSGVVFSPAYAKDGFCVAGDPNHVLMQVIALFKKLQLT